MSIKGFFQFIIILLLFGGGYAVFMRDQLGDNAKPAIEKVDEDPSYISDINFAKQALHDVQVELEVGRISEREANDRFQNIIHNLYRLRGVDPNKTEAQLTQVEKAKIMRILTAVDPKSIYTRYGIYDTQGLLEQKQQDIETEANHMKKVSFSAKILAFFAPKDSDIAKQAKNAELASKKLNDEKKEYDKLVNEGKTKKPNQ